VTVHRSKDLHADWCGRRHGIPVTNPARTLVDLGAVARPAIVEDAVERALVTGLVTVDGLEATRAAHARPGRGGCGVLRAVLEQRALGERPADSVLEARMAALLSRHGFPVPAFQHEVRDHAGRFVARVDFAYPSARLAIEVDGLATHGTAPALQADLARQNRLVALGWTVLRFTWADVVRRPAVVALSIARTYSRLS
jgi:very-short-patch-repair endonuclease